jgi:hypothetical protein
MGREPDSPARKGARVARRCRRSPPPGMRSSGTRSCTRSRRAVEASHSLHRVEREGSRQPLVYEHLWTPHMVTGKTLDEVGHRFEGDVLGSDPQAAWGHATAGAEDALRAPAALEGRVHTSIGRIPTREYAMHSSATSLCTAGSGPRRRRRRVIGSRARRGGVWLLQAPRAHPARLRAVRQARRYARCCRHPNQASRAARPKGIVE